MTNAIVLSIILITFLVYFLQSFSEVRSIKTLRDFLLLPRPMEGRTFFATAAASNIALAAVLFVLASWGYLYGPYAIVWAVIFWCFSIAGFLLIIPRIGDFIRKMGTLHEFLGATYENSRYVRQSSAVLTILTYFTILALEIYIGTNIVKVFAPDVPAFVVVLTMTFLIAVYCAPAGYAGIVRTDILQICVVLVGGVCGLLLARNYWSAETLTRVYGDSQSFWAGGPFFIISSIIFWVGWFPVSMDMWQRSAATRNPDIPRNYLVRTILFFAPVSAIFVLLGVVAHLLTPDVSFAAFPLEDFVKRVAADVATFGDILLLGVFVSALIAALVSTVDTYVLAIVQAAVSDIYLGAKDKHLEDLNANENARLVKSSRILIFVLLGLAIPYATLFAYMNLDLLTISYLAFSWQFSLLPAVVVGVAGRLRQYRRARTAMYSIWAGVIVVALVSIYLAYNVSFGTPENLPLFLNVLYLMPVVGIAIGSVPFIVMSRRQAPTTSTSR